jgi:single-strand DNA-binding protein
MFNEAQLSVVGYVASEPQFRRVGNGIPKLTMKVAWTTRLRESSSGEWVDGNTSFVRVTCWRRLAENLATCLRKGEPVLLRGRLEVRPFTGKDGVRRVSVDVDASYLGYDLTRGVAGFRRVWEPTGKTAEQAAAENGVGHPGDGSADGEAPMPALAGGPLLISAGGSAGGSAGVLGNGEAGDLSNGEAGDLGNGAPGDPADGPAGDPADGPAGDPADEDIFDGGAIEALAEDSGTVATPS